MINKDIIKKQFGYNGKPKQWQVGFDALLNHIDDLFRIDIQQKKEVISKTPLPEKVFYDHIFSLIKNLLIDNINYKTCYYSDKSVYDLKEDTKERSNYILAEMEKTKHLINLE
ncbi:MAG: hypothetical protein WC346_05405 [Methanogenium sp.]|jgi:hypothetical protein